MRKKRKGAALAGGRSTRAPLANARTPLQEQRSLITARRPTRSWRPAGTAAHGRTSRGVHEKATVGEDGDKARWHRRAADLASVEVRKSRTAHDAAADELLARRAWNAAHGQCRAQLHRI